MNHRTLRTLASAGVATLAIAGAGVLAAAPAAAGTLGTVSWAVSNNQVGASGVQYTFTFTTADTGTIASITMTVPATTGGTPAVESNSGIGAGTVDLTSDTITYTVTSPVSVPADTSIQLVFSGLTNPSSATSSTSTVTTLNGSDETIDASTSQSVTFAAGDTTVTIAVAQSTTFSSDTQSFSLLLDPSLAGTATITKDVGLSVQSNAASGYTLSVRNSSNGLYKSTSPTYAIPAASAGMASAATWPGANRYGYSLTLTGPTAGHANLNGGNFAGYTSGGESVATASGPTGASAHTIALTNQIQVSYATPAGTYTDTLTYTVTPSY